MSALPTAGRFPVRRKRPNRPAVDNASRRSWCPHQRVRFIILLVRYRNWAAFDGLRDKVDPILAKTFGSMDAANKGAVDREKVREILGGQVTQELKLK